MEQVRGDTAKGSASSSASGLEFMLHPLVLVNISDQHTRNQLNADPGRVLGCVLGEQKGRVVHLNNTFEVKLSEPAEEGGDRTVDREHLRAKQELYKTTFPQLEVIGWYTTGAGVQPGDEDVHKVIGEVTESPILLKLDPDVDTAERKDLPIELYETELHVIDGVPSQIFVQGKYSVDSLDAERIAVDQVARILPSGSATCSQQLTSHMLGMHRAIKMLNEKVASIRAVLIRVRAGELPQDHALLRQVASMVQRLPLGTDKVRQSLLVEYNDSLLTAYLGVMTKGSASLHEMADKMNAAYERSSHRRGLF